MPTSAATKHFVFRLSGVARCRRPGKTARFPTVKALLPQLRKGKVVRGRLGVQTRLDAMTAEEAAILGLPEPAGAIVISVEPESPAARAGLRAGDVVVAFNDRPIVDGDQLGTQVAATPPGTRLTVRWFRDGQERQQVVTIEELRLDLDRAPRPPDEGRVDLRRE
jgi:serine protease Do